MAPPILVLSGGNALGAYHAGAWSALEAHSVTPKWLVATSVGAVTAAIIAGNAHGDRDAALQLFWKRAAVFDASGTFPASFRLPYQYAQSLASKLLGRPPLFNLRPPDLSGSDARPSMFDAGPMRRLLAELVDVDRLNCGEMRVTVTATDLASGEEVVFDTNQQRVEIDHIMASGALIPDFPPVEIGGRLLVDGGFGANLPIHLVFDEVAAMAVGERSTCFAIDLFPLAAPPPRGVLQAAQRQTDLMFASQTNRTLRAAAHIWAGHEPCFDVFLMAYEDLDHETALKAFDFTAGTLERRRQAGRSDMQRQIERWRTHQASGPGLNILSLKH
jgi:NTE family protein